MQYAMVAGERLEATPGAKGACETCGADALAKCGPKVMHHWAHAGRRHCDPWWENETPWHRSWKSLFPPECREISHCAPDGEIHRADIKTPGGLYIEVQHSALTEIERTSRETFYQNLIWVVDATRFANSFFLDHILPDPQVEWAQDMKWMRVSRKPEVNGANGLYFKYSLIAQDKAKWPDGDMHEVFSLHRIRGQVEEAYIGHHQYFWMRPNSTWLNARCPVYLDFGEQYIMRLETYPIGSLPCVRLMSRAQFVHDVSIARNANDICNW